MCILRLLDVEEESASLNDEKFSGQQIIRHVCVALKKYFELHLYLKVENLRDSQLDESRTAATQNMHTTLPSHKAGF